MNLLSHCVKDERDKTKVLRPRSFANFVHLMSTSVNFILRDIYVSLSHGRDLPFLEYVLVSMNICNPRKKVKVYSPNDTFHVEM